MKWRVIPLEIHDAYTNMGADEAILESVRDGRSEPTIRFYRWKPSAVSIGTFQSMRKEINIDSCRELGIDYIRRITGGGAVYHDFYGEITYSVIGQLSLFPHGIRESYAFVCGWVIDGLRLLGIGAEFAPINDVLVRGKKISGNAQTRRQGVLLQHGTILYQTDVKTMFSVLRVSSEKISDKMIKSVEERVTSVSRNSNASLQETYEALLKGFTKGKEYKLGALGREETDRAGELAKTVYATDGWNFSR